MKRYLNLSGKHCEVKMGNQKHYLMKYILTLNKERLDKMIKVTGKSREATNQDGVGFANSP